MPFNDDFRDVQSTQPPAAWIGGKRQLAARLVGMINAVPHVTYAEPFVGMGGVFFRRTRAPRSEVINDRNGEVVNLFRILQRHYPQFMDTLKFQITSRREFDRLKACDPATLTDLERAARFLYLQKLAFGGKVAGQSFGVDVTRGARFNLNRLAPQLEDVHERLSGVVIENLDWLAFIDRYDRPGTLFYLDPPYWGSEDDYGKAIFGKEHFALMASRLRRLKGSFVLSLNDVPEVRDTFSFFRMDEVRLSYSVSSGASTVAAELIITSGARDGRDLTGQ